MNIKGIHFYLVYITLNCGIILATAPFIYFFLYVLEGLILPRKTSLFFLFFSSEKVILSRSWLHHYLHWDCHWLSVCRGGMGKIKSIYFLSFWVCVNNDIKVARKFSPKVSRYKFPSQADVVGRVGARQASVKNEKICFLAWWRHLSVRTWVSLSQPKHVIKAFPLNIKESHKEPAPISQGCLLSIH